jgi:hypothetical protein
LQLIVVKNYFEFMTPERLEEQLLELKHTIARLGMPIQGSIQITHLRCGKKNCRCHQSDDERHGPYYLWYRRINGKLTTKSIDEEDLDAYRMWISNREKLEAAMRKMTELGSSYATAFKSTPRKSINPLSEMRGK